ncbi:MAG: hypothetical protein FD159_911 [Syntrophaceae bacterium]|nr:MAG: hypothetical protein FD159_911 [Syntrophaceae bacterium]
MKDKNEESKTAQEEIGTNSIKDALVKQLKEEHASAIQEYIASLYNDADFQKKIRDYTNKNHLLRESLELPAQEVMCVEGVAERIKAHRKIQEEILENEEIIKSIENHFLPKAKEEMRKKGAFLSGIIGAIVISHHSKRQQEIDALFDQVKMLVKDFETQFNDAMLEGIGIYYRTAALSRDPICFSFKNAPIDLSIPFVLRGLV